MRVRLLLFAGLREAVGKKEHALELSPGAQLRDALRHAEVELPALLHWHGRLLLSLNDQRMPLDTPLHDGDLIALLPPVSGGSDARALRSAPLSLDALIAEVASPSCGGLVTFTGVVRDHSRGQEIDHLEYEAYDALAEAEIDKIRQEARARWPQVRLAIAHRVGTLAIGDAAVMIAAAAPHRPEAFEACRFAIDTLKRTVPIWKKEFGADGGSWVEENP